MTEPRAVVLVSGGLDSATVLALARAAGRSCYALSFDYGQRHRVELEAAARVALALGAAEHRLMPIGLGAIGGSALTDPSIAVPEAATSGIPVTYVPARNTVFLALALGWAEVLDADSVEWFKQHGGLTRANGDHFRQTLLSRGGSEDAMTLFRKFTGREPYIEPLLKRRGLDRAAAAPKG